MKTSSLWGVHLTSLKSDEEISVFFFDLKTIYDEYPQLGYKLTEKIFFNVKNEDNYYIAHHLIKVFGEGNDDGDPGNFFLILAVSKQNYRIGLLIKKKGLNNYIVAIFPCEYLKVLLVLENFLVETLEKIAYKPFEWATVDLILPA